MHRFGGGVINIAEKGCSGYVTGRNGYFFNTGTLKLIRKLAGRKDLNIILVLFDAIGADHMSCYGHSSITTPYIDAFVKDAILFEKALVSSTETGQSLGKTRKRWRERTNEGRLKKW